MIDDFKPSGGTPQPQLGQHKLKVIEPPVRSNRVPLLSFDETTAITDEPQQAPPTKDGPLGNLASTNFNSDPQSFKSNSRLHKIHWPFNRTHTILIVAACLLLIGGTVAAIVSRPHAKAGVFISHKPPKPKPVITTVASNLSGLPVDPSVNQRPVTAVMIENSIDARPQSGLDQASVVFEAIAEGGVTRFMGLFQDTQPDYIGPVRSARPYYVQWALGFDAGYSHVGGSPDALADIKSWNVRNLDQFANSGAYSRISGRYAPHNVYTSIARLNQLEQSKGYTSSSFTGFARKADAASKTPNAASIDMTFSGPLYNSHYDYDAKSNSYRRSEAGAAHMEVSSSGVQSQITPKVLVAMVVSESRGALDASGAYYSNYNPIGSGAMYVFQDGTVTTGTWSKAANTAPLTFNDAAGKPLKLNAGQTWVSALLSQSNLSYK